MSERGITGVDRIRTCKKQEVIWRMDLKLSFEQESIRQAAEELFPSRCMVLFWRKLGSLITTFIVMIVLLEVMV
jgi:hypothetical protein